MFPHRPGDESCADRPPAETARPLVLTREAVRRVDAEAIGTYGIPGIVLMENAARAVAMEAFSMAVATGRRRATIWCGPGNNGGDGYAAARHLHNAGLDVVLVPVGTPRDGGDAATNRTICERMDLRWVAAEEVDPGDDATIVIDGLLGTGLDRPPEGAIRDAIGIVLASHAAGAPVLAIDLPSGLDADTGLPLETAVRAHRTVTFVAAKPGLLTPPAAAHVGELVVADIGVPRELVERLAIPAPRRRGSDAGRRMG